MVSSAWEAIWFNFFFFKKKDNFFWKKKVKRQLGRFLSTINALKINCVGSKLPNSSFGQLIFIVLLFGLKWLFQSWRLCRKKVGYVMQIDILFHLFISDAFPHWGYSINHWNSMIASLLEYWNNFVSYYSFHLIKTNLWFQKTDVSEWTIRIAEVIQWMFNITLLKDNT